MPFSASASSVAVSLHDARPFFEKALQFGVQNGIIDTAKLDAIRTDGPKGMVQLARHFGSEFLRPDLEKAKDRIVNLVSLSLEESSGGDLRMAAEALRDHSFLSRSKAGSDLLKALFFLSNSTRFDTNHKSFSFEDTEEKKLKTWRDEWSLKSFVDYQSELAMRNSIQQEKDAAVWLAEHLGMSIKELEDAHNDAEAEAVIRTALLTLATRRTSLPDWVEFRTMVTDLRKKYRTAKIRAAAQAEKLGKSSARTQTLPLTIPNSLPDEFRNVVETVRQSMLVDLPRILESALPVRALFTGDGGEHHAPLHGRYFWIEDIASEVAHHEQAISDSWGKAIGGGLDESALLTLFVCVATKTALKTSWSEKAAKTLIRKIQKSSTQSVFDPDLARCYIKTHAPAQHQEGYLHLWDVFVEEAQSTLQSDSVFALKDALALLHRECQVTA